MMVDKQYHYGLVSKLFHWVTAFLIAWQFAKFFDRIGGGEHWVADNIVSFHISIGFIIFVLAVARIIWAIVQRPNRPVNPQARNPLVTLGHLALYALLALTPLMGIAVMVGNGYGLEVFGWQLVAPGEEITFLTYLGAFHSPIAWLFLVVVLGHTAMAIKHHLMDDKKVLRSML